MDTDALQLQQKKQTTLQATKTQEPVVAENSLQSQFQSLQSSKKSRSSANSESYNDITHSMGGLLSLSSEPVSADPQMREQELFWVLQNYDRTIETCQTYLASHKHTFSKVGKQRKAMITNILSNLQRDRTNLQVVSAEQSTQDETKNWGDILAEARAHTLDITQREDIGTAGDNTSELLVIGSGDNTVFFKETEMVKNTQQMEDDALEQLHDEKAADQVRPYLSSQNAQFMSFTLDMQEPAVSKKLKDGKEPLNNQELNLIFKSFRSSANISKDEFMALKPYLRELMQVASAQTKASAISGVVNTAGIQEGRNLSSRNVATSRVAAMVGMSSIVAPSQMVTVKRDGQPDVVGTAMKKASGKPIDAFPNDQHSNMRLTSTFVRQMSNLQVTDFLCGQVDRHDGNFMLQSTQVGEHIMVTGAAAFDNDMSFGLIEPEQMQKSRDLKEGKYNHLPMFLKEDGSCAMPHMDKTMRDYIMNLDMTMLRYKLCDLIQPDELDAMAKRLDAMQKAIAISEETVPGFLVEESQWNAGIARDMAQQEGAYVYDITQKLTRGNKDADLTTD